VTGWLRAAALAQANGARVSSHIFPEISAQLLCATPTAHWLEYIDFWNPVLAEPLKIVDGMAIVDGTIGTGVARNEKAVERLIA
jgi:mandelate racemase